MAGYTSEAKGPPCCRKYIHSHKVHFIDIDCGPGKPYPDYLTALTALCICLDAYPDYPKPLIILSGTGLHLYWPYHQEFDTVVWRTIAWMFRAVFEHVGLAIDGKVGIDAARLLRPPGTVNRKRCAELVNVRVLDPAQDDYALLDVKVVARALQAYMQQHDVTAAAEPETKRVDADDSDLGAGMPGLDPYSAHQIAQAGCLAAIWFEHNGGDAIPPKLPIKMHQADWFAMARLAKFSVEGEAWFHQYGAKYRGTAVPKHRRCWTVTKSAV